MDKTHDGDALCIATFQTGVVVPFGRKNFYRIAFRPRQTRRQYRDKPRRGLGRVRYQVNEELDGFRKGDIVLVKGNWVKQITAIYGDGRLAFRRVKGQPPAAYPKDCQLLERERTIVYERVV